MFVGVLASLLVGGLCCAEVPGNVASPEAVAQVRSGALKEANAAWWGFNRDDATDTLQAAIDSGVSTLRVPDMGAPWIVRPVRLHGNLEVLFEKGALVLAKKDEFKGGGDSLFTAGDAENLTLRGPGATLRMRKEDYQSKAYKKAEWRTTLDFGGCTNLLVEGLRLENSGGDGIYLGSTKQQRGCKDVVIRDVVCDGHHRQGISVISAENLLIEHCTLSNTKGTAPQAGIDLEPNQPDEQLTNCVIRDCVMENNSGAGILMHLKPLNKTTRPISITVERCTIRGGLDAGIGIGALKDDGPQGRIEVRQCSVDGCGKAGTYIYDKSRESALIRFVDCTWRNTWARKNDYGHLRVPVLINVDHAKETSKPGGIEFQDCQIFDKKDRPAVLLKSKPGADPFSAVKGTITVHNRHGARLESEPEARDLELRLVEARK